MGNQVTMRPLGWALALRSYVFITGEICTRDRHTHRRAPVRVTAEACSASKVTAVHVCRQTSRPSRSQP